MADSSVVTSQWSPMTWLEFKQWVNRACGDDVPVWFIDVSYPSRKDFEDGITAVSVDNGQLVVC